MATITKRKDRQWQVKIRRKGQKSISKTFSKKALAERWAREIENKLDEGTFIDTKAAGAIVNLSNLDD